jgi:hypothetical protein
MKSLKISKRSEAVNRMADITIAKTITKADITIAKTITKADITIAKTITKEQTMIDKHYKEN